MDNSLNHEADLPARHRLGKMLNRAAGDDAAGGKADQVTYGTANRVRELHLLWSGQPT